MQKSFNQLVTKKATTCFFALALSFTALTGRAQNATAVMALIGPDPTLTAYTGPRFPGGPDSLRALLSRAVRPVNPALVGQLFLQLKLTSTGAVQKATLLVPPRGTPAAQLAKNPKVQALLGRLVQGLPAWQPGPGTPGQNQATLNTVTLPLPFGPADGSVALDYSDENPTFPATPDDRRFGVAGFVQKRVRYPVQDMRNRVEGIVYAYFEVSETGVVEQRRIVGSVSPTLDAEVLRALALLPNALTPPRQAGRPVRVGYVLPFNFKML
ncbi:energy transducer TonB [Hymenobacter sp. H14-R3]|uniref:energy transducer TonB n=1 Tax=Hymenobacter sp. H14-R3 TaxID=3046308 RepID=UPI0024B89B41|nr:energy transducer TonB [Hymenobacter sp. H14-R3]MDJ0366813.1 energy transducer TonB [Hymenobacter sp. H14-R3]